MNLFVIPSWYPSLAQPVGGVFTQEQVEAIADLCPEINVIVSSWGHYDGEIPVRKPWDVFKVLAWYFSQQKNQVKQNKGVWEVFNPAISWSHRLPLGGAKQLIGVNRRNLKLAIERFGPIDLIHAHVSYPGGYIASVISKEFDIPYVITEHMGPFPFQSLLKNGEPIKEISMAFDSASQSIAVSPSLARRIASFGIKEPMVIPNLVDERIFSPGAAVTDKTIFFTLCGISRQKGIDTLLEAIALWNPPANLFEFRIGGDGPMLDTYKAKALALGLSDRVRWLGPVSRDDAPRLFRECHVYVMPSMHETFGVVYAEALACGKPVIATRCGGPESIVKDFNGRLVDIGDVRGLSETMQTMAKHFDQYNSVMIRQDFEERFSRIAVVKQLKMLYSEILRGKKCAA